ncbi:hypothetical protein [[Eubacterium] cellulosolvens]
MTYTDVFGGATLYPAGQTYLSLTFSTDQTLSWPIEQQIGGDVVASIMDLDPTGAGLNVDMPDARQASNGIQSVFNNVGANTVTIRDATGGTIISLASGAAWVVYLSDNTTEAGTWRTFQLGASVSVANASALAGAGLKAISTTLNQRIAPTSTAVTPITWTDSNRAQMTIWTGGVGVLNFPSPGAVGSDWFAMVRNSGSGDLTLTPPSGTIDGSATLAMAPGESSIIVTDGTNFFTVGYGQSSASAFDFIEINVAGSGDYTLSGVELNRVSYRFTGTLTGNRNIIVPGSVQQYWVDNSTSGAFSFFVKTAPQVTPIQVLQGDRNILYCDGTDVVSAESATVSFPIAVSQGGTGANTAANARVNLGVPPETRLINTPANGGLAGGGDLTGDRNLTLDANNLTAETTVDTAADVVPMYDDSATAMRKVTVANLVPKNNDFKRKANGTVRSSTTTVTDDPDLAGWSIPSAGIYIIQGMLHVDVTDGVVGFRWHFQTTSFDTHLASSQIIVHGYNGSINTVVDQTPDADQQLGITAAGDYWFALHGMIRFTAATTLDFQWAQSVSGAAFTTLDSGSWINLIRAADGNPTASTFLS